MAAKRTHEEEFEIEAGGAIDDPEPESTVRVSREAQYKRRIAEINEDVAAGRCSKEEFVERTIDAAMARAAHLIPAEKHAEARRFMVEAIKLPQVRKVYRLDE